MTEVTEPPPGVVVVVVVAGCSSFIIFAIGGSLFYFVKGTLRGSSRGRRLAGGVQEVSTNGPDVCRWAAWRAAVRAILLGVRQVDGPLNTMVAWGAANAISSMHRGRCVAVREGLKGAAYAGLGEIALYGLQCLAGSEEISG